MGRWTLGKNDDFETLEYVEISEVSRSNIENIATNPRGEEPSRASRRLRHGDTFLSTVRPDRGSYFLALNPPENRVASTGFAVLTPTELPWSFLHAALTQPEVSDHLGHMADGGAYPAVRPEIIGAMKVAMLNELKMLEAFHRTCAPLFEHAEANRTQSLTLATLRDILLPQLLLGKLCLQVLQSREVGHGPHLAPGEHAGGTLTPALSQGEREERWGGAAGGTHAPAYLLTSNGSGTGLRGLGGGMITFQCWNGFLLHPDRSMRSSSASRSVPS